MASLTALTCSRTYVTATVVLAVLRLLTAGVYRKSLRVRWLPNLFRPISSGVGSESIRHKIHENLWYCMWHTWSFGYNAWLLCGTRWFGEVVYEFHTELLHVDYGSFRLSETAEWFLDVNLAFWTTCAVFLFVETIRKDFHQMLVHHIFTLALIAGSNFFRQQRYSLMVLLLHDAVDIFLYAGKCAVYKNRKCLADALFAVFASLYFFARLLAFPIYCIYPCWNFMRQLPPQPMWTLPAMLSGLYVLHLFWWSLIVKMIKKAWRKRGVEQDVRSQDESDLSPKDSKKKHK